MSPPPTHTRKMEPSSDAEDEQEDAPPPTAKKSRPPAGPRSAASTPAAKQGASKAHGGSNSSSNNPNNNSTTSGGSGSSSGIGGHYGLDDAAHEPSQPWRPSARARAALAAFSATLTSLLPPLQLTHTSLVPAALEQPLLLLDAAVAQDLPEGAVMPHPDYCQAVAACMGDVAVSRWVGLWLRVCCSIFTPHLSPPLQKSINLLPL